jgi:hypothetical protein
MLLPCLLFAASPASSITTIYVSPKGMDHWSGSLPEANRSATDGPVATLDRAFALARECSGSVKIQLRGGVFTRPLLAADSCGGTALHPWRVGPYRGETVILRGSTPIAGWEPVSSDAVRDRLPSASRPNVLEVDLRTAGVSEIPELTQRGSPPIELFCDGKRMPLSRYPETGWSLIADVPQTGDSLLNEGLARERRFDNVPVGRHYGRFSYAGDRPSGWKNTEELWLHGYWTWDWSDSYQRVKSIDVAKKEITVALPHHNYGYTRNQRYAFYNVLEELDRPGEWALDRKADKIYFWPPSSTARVTISAGEGPLARLRHCAHIVISGMTFEENRGGGILLEQCDSVVVAGCTFTRLGADAAVIRGGTRSGLQSCDIYDVAMGGIRIEAGDRQTLTPGGDFSVNNHIHHYSTWLRTGQYGVWLWGVGNRLANTSIHDAPFEAIYVTGNDHLIEYNDIHDVCRESGDAGALHTGRDWTWRGNVIRYNYWHHLQGPGLHGVMGVYLDDWASGFTVYGNLFYRAGRAMMVGGGRDNIVQNNIFLGCAPSVHLDARGLGWAGYYFEGPNQYLVEKLNAVPWNKPPYSTRYPELLTLYQDEPAIPKHNRIVNNVSQGGRWLDVYDYPAFDLSVMTIGGNLVADSLLFRHRNKDQKGWDPYYLNIDWVEGFTTHRYPDAGVAAEFPRDTFLDPSKTLVMLKDGKPALPDRSPAYAKGFVRIPTEKIGLYRDTYRKALPK